MSLTSILHKIIRKLQLKSVVNSTVDRNSKVEAGSSFVNSTMSRHSFCGYGCDIYYTDIGGFTSIANGVVIGGGMHPMHWVGMSPVFYEGRDSVKTKFSRHKRDAVRRTIIGNDVWIGRSAIVLSGVSIGNVAVVGAGAVVTKEVPPFAIVAGNPAKIIRYRFEPSIIKRIELSAWWDIPHNKLIRLANEFTNVENFLDKVEKEL